ncbi:MAG: HprK-related kinase A, partial [Alphaproteobacteria bacterium]
MERGSFRFRVGPFTARVESTLPILQKDIIRNYQGYPLVGPDSLIDFNIRVRATSPWRRWVRPKVIADTGFANTPFVPLPGDLSILAFEMGLNWLVGTSADQYLVFHSGLVARDDKAVIMPGESGRGKSTLTAGLSYNGWRMFSDEFALLRPETLELLPYPRPISLKNQSISVLGARVPEDHFSRVYENTPKGTIR